MRSYHIRKMVVLQKDEKGFGTYFEIPYTEYRTDGSIYIAKVQKILVVNGIID